MNRVQKAQKATPRRRNTRGYVWIDEDSYPADNNNNNTARTASPDYISNTPIPPRRVIPKTPPSSSQAELEAENAQLRKKLRQHHRRSRQRRSRDDSEDDSFGSSDEEGNRKVSFVHQQHHHTGNKPFLALHDIYPSVNIKYFKQIYWGTFKPSQSMRLVPDEITWNSTTKGKKDKDEKEPEAANMVQLLHCFDVYSLALCKFAARPHVALDLHEALLQYRGRLTEFSLTYQFDSVRVYHYAFMTKRIFRGQDDPSGSPRRRLMPAIIRCNTDPDDEMDRS